jgi:hypothetical protein
LPGHSKRREQRRWVGSSTSRLRIRGLASERAWCPCERRTPGRCERSLQQPLPSSSLIYGNSVACPFISFATRAYPHWAEPLLYHTQKVYAVHYTGVTGIMESVDLSVVRKKLMIAINNARMTEEEAIQGRKRGDLEQIETPRIPRS